MTIHLIVLHFYQLLKLNNELYLFWVLIIVNKITVSLLIRYKIINSGSVELYVKVYIPTELFLKISTSKPKMT